MINRAITPLMPPQAYKTYQVTAPLSTHFVAATCEEVSCPEWLLGWQTGVDERTGLGQEQAYYIRHGSGRGFREERRADGLTVFTFWAGQRCFRSGDHRRRLEREERFLIRDGDYRGNPRGTAPVEVSATSWADSFGEHQEKLADAAERG